MNAMDRWASECAEWQAIKDEMLSARDEPVTAYQVSLEQRKRMLARGDRPMRYPEDFATSDQGPEAA